GLVGLAHEDVDDAVALAVVGFLVEGEIGRRQLVADLDALVVGSKALLAGLALVVAGAGQHDSILAVVAGPRFPALAVQLDAHAGAGHQRLAGAVLVLRILLLWILLLRVLLLRVARLVRS